ncbi:MAG: hypothetical protein RL490_1823, partial [Pseudomonadota bacterium]
MKMLLPALLFALSVPAGAATLADVSASLKATTSL